MDRILTSEIRKNLTHVINRVLYRGERIILRRRNKDVAVLISVEDAALLEELEDRIDAEDARKALAEGEFIPWDEAKKELEA